MKSKDEQLKRELPVLEKCYQQLQDETPLREAHLSNDELKLLRSYSFLSAKPMLIALNLDENQVTNVDSLRRLTNLRRLSIRHNNVHSISTFGNLINLTYLNLTGNKSISEVSMLKDCKNLNYLILGDNNISHVDSLSSLGNLINLDISYNKVTEIPDSFSDMKSLKGVRVVGCDISYLPVELKDRIFYYNDDDIAQYEKETGKNASIMGRETRKFLMWIKRKREY